MNEKTFDRILGVIAVVVGVVLFAAFRMASAQDSDLFQSNDMNTQTAGDVSSNNKTFAFGYSMGDVDIAGCLGSTQWTTILGGKQKLVINWPCMAEFYLRNEKWGLAAMALCNVPGILEEFASEVDCEVAHDFKRIMRAPKSATIIPKIIPDDDDDDDERRADAIRDEQLEQLAEQLAQYGAQVQQTEQRQQVQQQQIEVQQQHEDVRQRKLELIQKEFGDNGT
jgi:hypothetical protein